MNCRHLRPISPYLQLIKFHYHISYINVIFGALLFSRAPSIDLARSLIFLYLFFNVFLYGGIYTFNDIADVDSDRTHPLKSRRPLASGKISIRAALVFAALMIAAGMGAATWHFDGKMAWTFAGFLAINAIYSCGARNIPVLDLIVNSLTHPLRFMMGVSLTGREATPYHLAAIFLMALGLVSLRRLLEMSVNGSCARRTLRHYSAVQLLSVQWIALAGLLALFVLDRLASWGFFLAVIPTYLVLVFGSLVSAKARHLLSALWTR
jgi:decaprenyl-phosphate phosphoribosyltransferase